MDGGGEAVVRRPSPCVPSPFLDEHESQNVSSYLASSTKDNTLKGVIFHLEDIVRRFLRATCHQNIIGYGVPFMERYKWQRRQYYLYRLCLAHRSRDNVGVPWFSHRVLVVHYHGGLFKNSIDFRRLSLSRSRQLPTLS